MDLKKRFKLIMVFYFVAVASFVISCGNAILNHNSRNGLTGILFLIGMGSGLVAVLMLKKFRAEAERLKAEREAREAQASALDNGGEAADADVNGEAAETDESADDQIEETEAAGTDEAEETETDEAAETEAGDDTDDGGSIDDTED